MTTTFYLRDNEQNELLAEATISNDAPEELIYPIHAHVQSVVHIHPYSTLLLHTPADKQSQLVSQFDFISRLSWWYFDEFRALPATLQTYEQGVEWIRDLFTKTANRHNLTFYEQ